LSIEPDHAPGWTEWTVSAVNGLVGDHLSRRRNALAIDMALIHANRPLALSADAILEAHPRPTGQVCLLVHGLGGNEGVWVFRDAEHGDVSYGALLAAHLGYTPFYLRYNTGLPVTENGRRLAALIDRLLAVYPVPVRELVLIGHSMGGLVLRGACQHAVAVHRPWVEHVTRMFYLGTPHDGAGLENLAHQATTALHALGSPITRILANFLDIRSEGVKDLRHGDRLDADVLEDVAGAPNRGPRRRVPWLAHARHYLVLGTLTADPSHVMSRLFGDGLVSPPRAPAHPPTNRHIQVFPGIRHLGLARTPEIYRQIREWCETP